MTGRSIIPTAEPFFFPGNEIGCLLIHGFTGTPKEMLPVGEYLAEKGYSVLGIRLAGHATHITDMNRVVWKDWLTSVEDGVNLLQASTKRLFLIGLSMGGLLSLASAPIFSPDGVIAMSTPYDVGSDWRLRFVNFVNILHRFIPEVKKGPPDWQNPDAEGSHASYATYPIKSIPQLLQLFDFSIAQLPKIKSPTLLVNSKLDATAPPDHAEMFISQMTNTEVERLTLEKSGHVITREPEQDILFEAVGKFIEKHT